MHRHLPNKSWSNKQTKTPFPWQIFSWLYFKISETNPQGTSSRCNIDENSYLLLKHLCFWSTSYLNINIYIQPSTTSKAAHSLLPCSGFAYYHSVLPLSSLTYVSLFLSKAEGLSIRWCCYSSLGLNRKQTKQELTVRKDSMKEKTLPYSDTRFRLICCSVTSFYMWPSAKPLKPHKSFVYKQKTTVISELMRFLEVKNAMSIKTSMVLVSTGKQFCCTRR